MPRQVRVWSNFDAKRLECYRLGTPFMESKILEGIIAGNSEHKDETFRVFKVNILMFY